MTTPNLINAPTPDLTQGFDRFGPVSAQMAKSAVSEGYAFVVRYVNNLSTQEIADILGAGLALMLVQQAPSAYASSSAGSSDGQEAARLAQSLAVPPGMCIFVDVENTANNTKAEVTSYLRGWSSAVSETGYVPGIYVGTTMFTAQELYEDFGFEHYWKAGSPANTPFVYKRGYQLYQVGSGQIAGFDVDFDLAQTDLLGGRLMWLTSG
ncbi:DUF1906 domain-containing protein [Pseudenhygromyxa sp. WMMC2535]|uniref:glycoside hydrolase domain-containing protein n=1 Tax=Pseudenhygromyxa sp. WMMC2535 TaxID=2712867 RepID=UPI00155819A6|nr:glycoside hydrolase domain-containing protein [Pseudenhygromyxa sp. WMMC2535]NVB41000.1 DUF1906 domain-containing protein [Pseudenhygromyxa sp. WMMC2535]